MCSVCLSGFAFKVKQVVTGLGRSNSRVRDMLRVSYELLNLLQLIPILLTKIRAAAVKVIAAAISCDVLGRSTHREATQLAEPGPSVTLWTCSRPTGVLRSSTGTGTLRVSIARVAQALALASRNFGVRTSVFFNTGAYGYGVLRVLGGRLSTPWALGAEEASSL